MNLSSSKTEHAIVTREIPVSHYIDVKSEDIRIGSRKRHKLEKPRHFKGTSEEPMFKNV